MSLFQLSDDHFAAVRSEHSIHLDEIESYDDERYHASESGVRALLGDVDDFSTSEASLHVFMDEWNDTTLCGARLVKSLAKPMPNQVHFYSSPRKQAYGHQEQHSIDTVHKRRLIASMLYESLSEMLSSSHRDMGILALDTVARNIGSLACFDSRQAQKEELANLLTERMNAYESRNAEPSSGPVNGNKKTLCHKQKDELVDVLSEVFSKIEKLMAATTEGGTPRDEPCKKSAASLAATYCSDDVKSTSSRPTNERQSSFHSEVSSITSRTSASLYPDSPKFDGCSVYRLPVELKARPKPNIGPAFQTASTPKLAMHKLEGGSSIALQDSFSSFSSTYTEDASPKRPQRRGTRVASWHCPARLVFKLLFPCLGRQGPSTSATEILAR